MKNKAKNTLYAIIMMGIVLIIVMFMYYYSPTNEKTTALEASNKTLQNRVTELEKFYNEMPENKAKIEEMTKSINAMLEKYPADVKEEDTIYFALSSERLDNLRKLYETNKIDMADRFDYEIFAGEDTQNVSYASLNIGPQNVLASVGSDLVKGAKIENLEDTISFKRRSVDYQTITDYESLKALVQSINSDPEKKSINKLNYSTNEEGRLVGVLTVDFYSVSGTTKEYVAKELSEYAVGVDNLFIRSNVEED